MRELLEPFSIHIAGRPSARTRKTYETIARAFALFLETQGQKAPPTRADIEVFLARPRRDGVPRDVATRNQELVALRALAHFAVTEGAWLSDPTDRIRLARRPDRDPAFLTLGESNELFLVAGSKSRPHERRRNLAMLALLSLGLRVHELMLLDVRQVDLVSETLLGVKGKGGSVHDMPMNDAITALVRSWIEEREGRVAADEPALFVNVTGTRLSIRSVQYLFTRLRAAMGTAKRLTTKTMRHTNVTGLLTLGVDLVVVSRNARHADIRTTMAYSHLVSGAVRDAVRKLDAAIPANLVAEAVARSSKTIAKPGRAAMGEDPVSPDEDLACGHAGMDATSSGHRPPRQRPVRRTQARTQSGACCVGATSCSGGEQGRDDGGAG